MKVKFLVKMAELSNHLSALCASVAKMLIV